MELINVIVIFKVLHSLDINQALILSKDEQSIVILKMKDNRGIYYSINDTINNIPQRSNNNECAMTLVLLNKDRFKYPVYNSTISSFSEL